MNIMKRYFAMLEECDIRYVHFKSNSSLRQSFEGRGDFDVLVDRHKLKEIEQILLSLKAKRFNPMRYGNYPGVDNWLLFDENTGILHHLHLHYQLCTGKELVKDYVIPWDELLFSTRVKNDEYGIYTSSPELEYLLLNVRIVLKSKSKDKITSAMGCYSLYPSLRKEREGLYQNVSWEKITTYCETLFSAGNCQAVQELLKKSQLKGSDFIRLSRIVRFEFRDYRRMNGFVAALKSTGLMFEKRYDLVLSRKLHISRMIKKTTMSGGLIIAFVGVDGAGKSTTTQKIATWLAHKTECTRFYMGTGDGRVPLFAKLVKGMKKNTKKVILADKKSSQQIQYKQEKKVSFFHDPIHYVSRIMNAKMVYSIEKANSKKIRLMSRYRLNGGISLLDRFPQIEVAGCNDGPKISAMKTLFQNPRVLDRLIEKEKKQLSIVKTVKPDVVFRLQISAEESMRRKPEQTNIEVYREKKRMLEIIGFQGAPIIDIDAQAPYEEELLVIKRYIWDML